MTCDPSFYKHTQRLFLLLHERGLAYQANSLVNWDPVEKTVLANEQVDVNGVSWRSGAQVEKIHLKQWFLRITEFKEDLLKDLELLAKENRWPERVLSMQKNWIGKSKGSKLHFKIESSEGYKSWPTVEVFTTRADTLFGVQYIALSLNHPIVQEIVKTNPDLKSFVEKASSFPADSKDGFLLPGLHAINPASSLPDQNTSVQDPLPIYVAPYVLDEYGSGAVMGVPGHDIRDRSFWKKNQGNKPIRVVICQDGPSFLNPKQKVEAFVHKGILTEACGIFAGLTSDDAIDRIVESLRKQGHKAEHTENWRLRDWLISRQRYWGTPIPIIHCDSCGPVPVPASDLPVELPKLKSGQVLGKGGNPLDDIPDFVNTTCPKCHSPAKRETDTMDTFMDSSWYFFRFADPHNEHDPIAAEVADARLPVDVYVGGVEHAILHLLYARFMSKFLATTHLWPSGGGPDNNGEPFRKVITQGMVHGKTYTDPKTGRFLKPDEVDLSTPSKPVMVENGQKPNVSFEKMSKSKHNGVDPAQCIAKYGADTTRAHMLFQAPVSEVLEWDDDKIVGIQRWLQRVRRVTQRAIDLKQPEFWGKPVHDVKVADDATLATHQTIKSITNSLSTTYSLNTVISDLTKLTNTLDEQYARALLDDAIKHNAERVFFIHAYHRCVKILLTMLAPICPAFAEECWAALQSHLATEQPHTATSSSIFAQPWPSHSDDLIQALSSRSQTVAVQINGKFAFNLPHMPSPPDHTVFAHAFAKSPNTTKAHRDNSPLASPFDPPPARVAGIPVPTAAVNTALDMYMVEQIFSSEQGQKLFQHGAKWSQSDPRKQISKVVVVQGGRTVNFVIKNMSLRKFQIGVQNRIQDIEREERGEEKAARGETSSSDERRERRGSERGVKEDWGRGMEGGRERGGEKAARGEETSWRLRGGRIGRDSRGK